MPTVPIPKHPDNLILRRTYSLVFTAANKRKNEDIGIFNVVGKFRGFQIEEGECQWDRNRKTGVIKRRMKIILDVPGEGLYRYISWGRIVDVSEVKRSNKDSECEGK